MRVGTRLSDGMSDDQLGEFEEIIDRKDEMILNWLEKNIPNYFNDEVFQKMQSSMQLDASDPNLRAEYAATKWLELNRPDYRQVVAEVLDELRKEIIANRSKILN